MALDPGHFHDVVDGRERDYTKFDYQPDSSVDHYFPGTYYLDKVDEMHRRSYSRKQVQQQGQSRGISTQAGNNVNSAAISQALADPFNMAIGSSNNSRVGARGFSSSRPLPSGTIADPFNMDLGGGHSSSSILTSAARLGVGPASQQKRGYSTAVKQLSRALRYVK